MSFLRGARFASDVRNLTCIILVLAVSVQTCSALELVADFAMPVQPGFQPIPLLNPGDAVYMPSLSGTPLIGITQFTTQTALAQKLKEQEWEAFPIVQIDPQVLAMEQQFRPQYETQLNSKLHHWRSVCRPTFEQQEKLLAAGNEALDKSVRAMAMQQVPIQNGGQQLIRPVINVGQGAVNADPSSAITQALEKTAKEIFTKEQRDLLAQEEKDRKQYEKRAAVRNLIVLLDKRLILSESQRAELMTKLEEGWQQQWMNHVQNLIHGSESIPQIPDKLVKPLLNERQQKIWKDLAKNQHNHFFGGMHMFHNVPQMEPFKPEKLEPEG
ncbi:MAG: hypothetical protein RH917_20785 [Lacipirellulaceae bacterium]